MIRRLKTILAIGLLIITVGVMAPTAFADGAVETPGSTSTEPPPPKSGPVETPGRPGPTDISGTILEILASLITKSIA